MAKKKKQKKPGKKNTQIFLTVGLLMAAVFLPTTLLLIIAMMPSFVVILFDPLRRKTRGVTVGALNLAGCTPFLLELWTQGHDFQNSFSIIMDPFAISVIYAAAAAGYLVDWAMTGIVANFLYQQGFTRKKIIKERQSELLQRWGEGVTGDIPLDEEGFLLRSSDRENG